VFKWAECERTGGTARNAADGRSAEQPRTSRKSAGQVPAALRSYAGNAGRLKIQSSSHLTATCGGRKIGSRYSPVQEILLPKDPRQQLAQIARLVYARHLTDASGGNLSLRQANRIYLSPAQAGSRQQWQIGAKDVVVLDLAGNLIDGPDRRTREWQVHLAVYNAFERAGGVIHAQSGYFMAFVAAGKPLPPVLEHTQKFATIGLTRPARAHSRELARSVLEALEPQRHELEKHGIATLIRQHGIIVVGRDLDDAFDTLERIETNAQALLLGALLRHHLEAV